MALETIPQLVVGNGKRFGSAPAYHVRGPGGWEATSWETYSAEVGQAGAALVALGTEPGQAVCILGANRPEWVIFDVGAMAAGAIPAGIYTTSSPSECEYILNHSEAHVLLAESEAQWQKVAACRDQLPNLRHVVMMKGAPAIDDPMVLGWDGFLARGEGHEGPFDERLAALRPDAVGTYIYTSGTTGRPKAVMLTHDNLSWTSAQAAELAEARQSDRLLSYLPLSHIAEQMFTIHIAAVMGTAVYYAESIDKLLRQPRRGEAHRFLRRAPGVGEVPRRRGREAGRGHRGQGETGRKGHRGRPAGRHPPVPGARRLVHRHGAVQAVRQDRLLEGEGGAGSVGGPALRQRGRPGLEGHPGVPRRLQPADLRGLRHVGGHRPDDLQRPGPHEVRDGRARRSPASR